MGDGFNVDLTIDDSVPTADPNNDDDGGWDWDSTGFDNIFNKAAEKYKLNNNAAGANGKASVRVGGALAFSYTDHQTKTLITGTADLNSNDDMELTSNIVEDGVDLYSGQNSGLNIKAEEAIMGFAFSQAGADAGKVAVGGTFSYSEQDSDILAHCGCSEHDCQHHRSGDHRRQCRGC